MMEEPYYLRPDEIAKLTDSQIVGLYGRDRDPKTGAPKPVGPEKRRHYSTPEENKERTISILKVFGKTQAEAEAIWEKARMKRGS